METELFIPPRAIKFLPNLREDRISTSTIMLEFPIFYAIIVSSTNLSDKTAKHGFD